MRFLALSSLETGILALLIAAAIVAMYFLRLRHRRAFVSSSMLWGRVLDEQASHSLIEKLRKIISIIIAVTIAWLILIGLARPEVEALTGKNDRIVIVIDTSPTMGTLTADGRTRWEHATNEARNLLTSGGPTTEFRLTDTSGRIASAFTTDRSEIRQLIDKMKPVAAEPHFPKVDDADSLVYFISDGVAISQVPKTVKRISVFEKARNVGITAFEIRVRPSTPPTYEAYLAVQNFGTDPTDATVTISGSGAQHLNKTVTLAANESLEQVFDLTPFPGGGIRATVQSKDDALAADDVAYAYLPIKRRSRTLLVTRGNNYLQTFLKLDPFVDLTVVDPTAFKESPEVDTYIFDRFAPQSAPNRPALIIGVPDAPWLRRATGVVQKPEITTWMEDHPIMQFVPVHDIAIENASLIDGHDLTVIAASHDTPLIVASDKPRYVMLTFDLNSSDFASHVGFPVFIDNVLSWFGRDQLALRREPGTVEVPLANAQIRTIDDKVVPSLPQLNKTLFDASDPGLFTATQGDSRLHIAVNLANRNFSDVNRSTFRNDKVAVSEPKFLRHELWYYLLFAATILIAVEWLTYHKRITL